MRFLRSIGWLLVLISTPAWAFLKMSFSSSRPAEKKILNYRCTAANKHRGRKKCPNCSMWTCFRHAARFNVTWSKWSSYVYVPLPPLKMQMPPSLPSWILFRLRVGLLSVLIHTPAMALSKISLSSMKPRPVILNSGIRRVSTYPWETTGDSVWEMQTWVVD